MRKFWNFKNDANQPEDGILSVEGVLMTDESWFGGAASESSIQPSAVSGEAGNLKTQRVFNLDGVISSKAFRQALAKYRNVTVIINSPGGDVMAGAEMYSALREHSSSGKGKVTVKITALAASAASVVAMAGDEILMSPVAYMMIHNPWTIMAGNADDMRREADALDEIAEGIISAYQLRTGKSRAKLKELMDGESYMNARRCIAEGFADGLLYETEAALPSAKLSAQSADATAQIEDLRRGTPTAPDEEGPDEDDDEEEGVLMKAVDFGVGRAVACAVAHGMKVNPLRTVNFTDTALEIEHSLEDEIREDIARRAEMIASLF